MTTNLLTQRAYQRKRKAALKARGLCPWCGRVPPTPGRTRCEPCLVKARANSLAYMNRRRKFWKSLGWCQLCGKRDSMPNQSRCGVCAERQDEYKAMRRATALGGHLNAQG